MAICTECHRGHGYRSDACCLCNEYGFSWLGTFGGRALGPGVCQWWAGGSSCHSFGPYGACAGIRGLGSITITKDDTLNGAASRGARGPIQHLAEEDHHTRVTTPQGNSLVLLRFAEAVAPTPGLQVHRSHWVSHDAIDKAERRGNAAQLILTNGSIIPLSRGHMPELRAKGIL